MKGKRNLGIFFILLPLLALIVLPLYALATFFSQMASTDTAVVSGTATTGGADLTALISGGVQSALAALGIFGVISIILLPIGLYLASKYSYGFSIGAALRSGWEGLKRSFWFWVGLLLFFFVIELLFSGPLEFGLVEEWIGGIWYIIGIAFYFFIMAGFIKIMIETAKGGKPKFGTLFTGAPYMAKLFIGFILYMLIVLVGLILLIVPGLIWMYKYQLFYFYIVDKNMGIIESFKACGRDVKGSKWDLFSFNVLTQVLNFLGMLPLLLGLFVTVPVTMVGGAHIYLQLTKQATGKPTPSESTVKPEDLM